MKKRALLSVSDKRGIDKLAENLINLGYEIVSTGGTKSLLESKGIAVLSVSDITGFPECLDGRVKTLHPKIHGAILAKRDEKAHMDTLEELEISTFDLLAVNLYPFKETYLDKASKHRDKIENIDIGGPTMIRSAAKNYEDVIVLVDSSDYDMVVEEIEGHGDVTSKTRMELALKAFETTSHYDTLIAKYFSEKLGTKRNLDNISLTFEKGEELRYGENPHQKAYFFKEIEADEEENSRLSTAIKLHGKELSFNNINDATGAVELIREFEEPTVVAVKHTNPCGVGTGKDIHEAYVNAYNSDPKSIFGGIIALNREVDIDTAKMINDIFIEIVIAPSYEVEALEILKSKKNIRILKMNLKKNTRSSMDIKKVDGGILVQDKNDELYNELKVVTERIPSDKELEDLVFALKVVKHAKSNAIVISKDKTTLSVGPGQSSRIWALENAISQSIKTTKGSVMASDAFFPFADCVETAAKAGVTAIIHPGGSIKDEESIEMANKYGIAMVLTGIRHFKH